MDYSNFSNIFSYFFSWPYVQTPLKNAPVASVHVDETAVERFPRRPGRRGAHRTFGRTADRGRYVVLVVGDPRIQ